MQTAQIEVTGMTCGACTSKVTRAIRAIAGVGDVTVSLSTSQATVQYDESATSPKHLKSAVVAAGYGAGANGQAPTQPSKRGCCG